MGRGERGGLMHTQRSLGVSGVNLLAVWWHHDPHLSKIWYSALPKKKNRDADAMGSHLSFQCSETHMAKHSSVAQDFMIFDYLDSPIEPELPQSFSSYISCYFSGIYNWSASPCDINRWESDRRMSGCAPSCSQKERGRQEERKIASLE